MIFFFTFLFFSSSSFKRKLPHILSSTLFDNGTAKSSEFFGFSHISDTERATELQTICKSLEKDENIEENIQKLQTMSAKGDNDADFCLGNIFHLGLFNQPINDSLGYKYFEKGSLRGHPECKVMCSVFLRFGFAVP